MPLSVWCTDRGLEASSLIALFWLGCVGPFASPWDWPVLGSQCLVFHLGARSLNCSLHVCRATSLIHRAILPASCPCVYRNVRRSTFPAWKHPCATLEFFWQVPGSTALGWKSFSLRTLTTSFRHPVLALEVGDHLVPGLLNVNSSHSFT